LPRGCDRDVAFHCRGVPSPVGDLRLDSGSRRRTWISEPSFADPRRALLGWILRLALLIATLHSVAAQVAEVSIQAPSPHPVFGHVLSPFHLERRVVPPVRLANSPRLEMLVRSGNL